MDNWSFPSLTTIAEWYRSLTQFNFLIGILPLLSPFIVGYFAFVFIVHFPIIGSLTVGSVVLFFGYLTVTAIKELNAGGSKKTKAERLADSRDYQCGVFARDELDPVLADYASTVDSVKTFTNAAKLDKEIKEHARTDDERDRAQKRYKASLARKREHRDVMKDLEQEAIDMFNKLAEAGCSLDTLEIYTDDDDRKLFFRKHPKIRKMFK